MLLFPIADSYTMYCQPSLLSLHLPISRFLLLVHLCLGLFFLKCIGMRSLRWHLMMLFLSGLLHYSPRCLHHWDSGLIALAENTIWTTKSFQIHILCTYLQQSHASVYFTRTHPKTTKPKGNFHLGTLCKNKQQEVIGGGWNWNLHVLYPLLVAVLVSGPENKYKLWPCTGRK